MPRFWRGGKSLLDYLKLPFGFLPDDFSTSAASDETIKPDLVWRLSFAIASITLKSGLGRVIETRIRFSLIFIFFGIIFQTLKTQGGNVK